jgi:hypothetical protein
MKKGVLIFMILLQSWAWGQLQDQLKAAVDTTTVLIGGQLNYTLQIAADSMAEVKFPEKLNIAPFEIIQSFPIDTLRAQQNYLFTKRYALIQFDSGNYWIPPQRVLINGFPKISDSIPIRVNTVVVDTLKQPLFDIKPLIALQRNYDQLIARILWGILFLVFLIGGLWTYLRMQRRAEERKAALPPFEKAIEALKALEKQKPQEQEEYKFYYSQLTTIVRRYLEEDAKIAALESTSAELLKKLMLFKDTGKIPLEKETLERLQKVLETADLVKFARAVPEIGTASRDREWVESIVVETKEALPAPTLEELMEQKAYQEQMRKAKQRKQLIQIGIGVFALAVISLVGAITYYGYYPVRDELLGYPTKKLQSKTWVQSMYGVPPVQLSTPKFLERVPNSGAGSNEFQMGTLADPFYVALRFSPKPPSTSEQQQDQTVDAAATQALIDGILEEYQEKGATNMLVDSEVITTPSGLPALKIFGTLDLVKTPNSPSIRHIFSTLLFDFDKGKITLTLLYEKDDRYGAEIAERITSSLDLIKEL